MATIFLTALRESPQKHTDKAVPKVVGIDSASIVSMPTVHINDTTLADNVVIKVRRARFNKTYTLAENLGQYLKMSDFGNAASSPFNNGTSATVAASGNGAAASATSITAYFNAVSAATASTMLGIKLPAASTMYGKPIVVFNNTAVNLIVTPVNTDFLNGVTATSAGASQAVSAGKFRTFYASATNAFVTCTGPYS